MTIDIYGKVSADVKAFWFRYFTSNDGPALSLKTPLLTSE
jgi:hypothetical protein